MPFLSEFFILYIYIYIHTYSLIIMLLINTCWGHGWYQTHNISNVIQRH